ncbi:GntR family transcriptional regulator [Cerasicoccus arenae]|uniref:Transcriptional regulator n=1 Tax=Cerasicoccus arenae TaxID=424488 RepID=A0A8J3DHJ8_9BACT|nr:GntR family transcriptional regulator [Cerasicoccus arenae]MBK1859753.1 GntR family transcriptional regulator [Cerasicoccus arenae]GHB93620.1 transcriptional regulator [Cerasicoccus arenae]
MSFKPAALSDQLYAELKRRILRCELPPGSRLIEKALCEELEVSRTSLREALNRLSGERLVMLKTNCGFSVAPLTEESFKNICELRRVLESQAAALAAERATAQDIDDMRRAATVNAELDDPDGHRIYCEANRAFHAAVAASIDNLLLEEAILSALDKDQQPIYYGIDLGICTSPAEVSAEHLAIVAAIAARQSETARQLMWNHIGLKEDRILEALRAGRQELASVGP